MIFTKKKLLDRLVNLGIISPKVARESYSKGELNEVEDILLKKEVLDEEGLTKVKGEMLQVPYVDISKKEISSELLKIFSIDVLEEHKAIPFSKKGTEVKIGLVNPQDVKATQAIDFLVKKNNLNPKYFIVSNNGFTNAINKSKNIEDEIEDALNKAKENISSGKKDESLALDAIKKAPISKMVSVIIKHAIDGGASDIHIEPIAKTSRVRYRIDGILHTSLTLPIHIHSSLVSRVKVLANLKLDEKRIPQDGRIKFNINDKDIDCRVSIFPLLDNEKIVIRILDPRKGVLNLQDLGFNKKHIEIIDENIRLGSGAFFLTGPTGSGKTTTLYSILNILNKEGINIVTLEDPIEYFIEGINQSQVKPAIGFNFASGLRSLLRQDPDIIMIGEVRDKETADLSIHAALTGHFILSTLHTNSALGALIRLIDLGVDSFLLGPAVKIIITQRLIRKICEKCKAEVQIGDDLKRNVLEEIKMIPKKYLESVNTKESELKFYKGKGCSECDNNGYKSRMVIAEVLAINEELGGMISTGYNESKIKEYLSNQGMISIKQDGILKALKGFTSLEEIIRITKK
jgi:type IV pilus assembly protein PilB